MKIIFLLIVIIFVGLPVFILIDSFIKLRKEIAKDGIRVEHYLSKAIMAFVWLVIVTIGWVILKNISKGWV